MNTNGSGRAEAVSATVATRIVPAMMISAGAALVTISVALVSGRGVHSSEISLALMVSLGSLALFSALLLPPSFPLILTVVFLESPLPLVLDSRPSAYVTTGLMAWTALGLFFSGSRPGKSWANPLQGQVLFFAAYALLSAFVGMRSGNPAEYVAGDLFQIEEFAFLFILATRLVTDEKTLRRLLACGLGSTLLTAIWQLAASSIGLGSSLGLPVFEGAESGGALPRTINLNAVILFLALLSLSPVLQSVWQRRFVGLLLVPTVANLLLSFTRGLWLAALIAVIFCVWLMPRGERAKLLKTIALATLLLVLCATLWRTGGGTTNASLFDAVQDRLSFGVTQVEQGFQGEAAVETRRFVEITTIAPQILSSPLFGKGLGGLYWIDAVAFVNQDELGTIDYHFMHNLYLQVGFRLGLVGFAAFIFLLYSYFREALRAFGRVPDGVAKGLMAGLIAGVAGEVVLSMTSPTILNHPTAGLVACAMALTFRLPEFAAGPAQDTAR